MDYQLDKYRQAIKQLLLHHAEYTPSHGSIETQPVFDEVHDSYLLLDIGWDRTGRVHSVLLHLQIKEDKVWIEVDGTEEGVAQELVAAGIPKERIVLGFYRPQRRALTEFAVA